MDLKQMKARLEAIIGLLAQFKDKAEFSEDEKKEINDLSSEYEKLEGQIETAEKLEAMTKKASSSAGRQTAVTPVAQTTQASVGENRQSLDPKAGFSHAGEFYRAVIRATGGEVDKRLRAGAQEKIGEDGGYLIPADFRQEIQKKVVGDESLLPMTQQFKTGSNSLELPTSEVAPWDSSGAIQAYWEGESTEHAESKAKFGLSQFRLHKLTAMVKVTDELLDDASALESWIKANAPDALLHKVNSAIIAGDGVGKPQGIINSAFAVSVAAEGSQTADTVNFANVNKMLGRLLPMSLQRAVWLVHPALLEQIRAMRFDLASDTPVPVYMPPSGISGAPYGSLYGRPIMPMMAGVKAPGDVGDIMLVDLKYYYTVMKTSGIKSDVSTHVHFKTDEQLFKFQMRLGGQCPYKAAVNPENGSYSMSGFITLAAR